MDGAITTEEVGQESVLLLGVPTAVEFVKLPKFNP